MLSLLLSGAVLLGVGTTSRMGEDSPAPDILASLSRGPFEVEGWWSPVDKIESPGWATGGHVDAHRGWAVGGVGYTYRKTNAWSKDALWLRAGVRHRGLKAVVAQDVKSHNKVTKLEARARGRVGRFVVEPHAFVARYRQSGEHMIGYGAGLRLGVGL